MRGSSNSRGEARQRWRTAVERQRCHDGPHLTAQTGVRFDAQGTITAESGTTPGGMGRQGLTGLALSALAFLQPADTDD
jgi:hypothetical protein